MMSLLKKLASLRLTLVGMAVLAVLAVVASRNADVDVSITAVPLAILAINLFAALVTNRSFRSQTGLLIFHIGLLLVFLFINQEREEHRQYLQQFQDYLLDADI